MQINNYYLSPLGIGQTEGQPVVDSPGNSGGPDLQSQAHSLSPELTRLIQLVGQEPEVRADVVKTVQDRLAQGIYLLPASAQQTAQAILQAKD